MIGAEISQRTERIKTSFSVVERRVRGIFPPLMDNLRKERVLRGLRPEEIPDFRRMLDLWERADWISHEDAAEWWRRIYAAAGVAPAPEHPLDH